MPNSTGSSSDHKPTNLVVDSEGAKRRVRKQIGAAEILLQGKTVPTPAAVDMLSDSATNWASTTHSILMLLFDSPEYANSFELARRRIFGGRGAPTAQERLTDILSVLRSGQQNLVGLLDTIDVIAELSVKNVPASAPAQEAPASHRPVIIHARDIYGTVLVESLVKSIESHVEVGLDGADVADAFRAMTDALRTDTELDEPVRAEALQYLEYLSETSATEPGKRRPALIAAAVTWMNGALTVATKVGELWQECGPTIEHGLRTIGL